MEELFNEEDVFNIEIDFSQAVPHISSYYKSKLNLCDKTTQRGFILTATDEAVGNTSTFWVFRSFIISYKSYGYRYGVKSGKSGAPRCFEIEQHSLSLFALGKMKLHKIFPNGECISGILSQFEQKDNIRLRCNRTRSYLKHDNLLEESLRLEEDNLFLKNEHHQIQKKNNLLEIEKEKLVFELSDCKKELEEELEKVETERYVYSEEKKKFLSERKAFEKEKKELEKELAKYKSNVSNCQREIKAYGL